MLGCRTGLPCASSRNGGAGGSGADDAIGFGRENHDGEPISYANTPPTARAYIPSPIGESDAPFNPR